MKMKKKILLLLIFSTSFAQLNAQNDVFWSKYNAQTNKIMETDKATTRESFPKQFDLYNLDINAIRKTIFSGLNKSNTNKVIITLPNVNGKLEEFELFDSKTA